MKTTIIGPGRLGVALARRGVALGHQVRLIHRGNRPTLDPGRNGGIRLEPIGHAKAEDESIVILAAPAGSDPASEATIECFLAGLGSRTVICSAVAYPGAPHETWAQGRQYVRFLCSPAVADPSHAAILLVLQEAAAEGALLSWFGPAEVFSRPLPAFTQLAGLFMATVVHLATLSEFLKATPGTLDPAAHKLASGTLSEARTLLGLFGNSPEDALEACASPGGMTERIVERFESALKSAREQAENES